MKKSFTSPPSFVYIVSPGVFTSRDNNKRFKIIKFKVRFIPGAILSGGNVYRLGAKGGREEKVRFVNNKLKLG